MQPTILDVALLVLLQMHFEGEAMSEIDHYITIVGALNSTTASSFTLMLVQLFGEKKTRTGEDGTITVARWRGKYYLLDYVPVPDGEKEGKI